MYLFIITFLSFFNNTCCKKIGDNLVQEKYPISFSIKPSANPVSKLICNNNNNDNNNNNNNNNNKSYTL